MRPRQPCHGFYLCVVVLFQGWAWTALAARDFAPNYVGAKPCPEDPSVLGYHNTTTLTNDMFLMSQDVADGGSEHEDEYVFTLCPRTVFDLGTNLNDEDDQEETPIIPFFDNTTFRCGRDGSIDNQCIIKGGFYQVIFDDDFWWLNNVTFNGITFQQNEHITVLGFGHPSTDIKFTNCRWKDNFDGEYLVAIYWDKFIRAGFEPSDRYRRRISELSRKTYSHVGPIERKKLEKHFSGSYRFSNGARVLQGDNAMYAGFTQCDFVDNAVEKAGILNQGGSLELFGCKFTSNRALVVVANIQDAAITVHGSTSFSQNKDKYGPVFLDSSSELKYLSEDTSGEGNVGSVACQGIFVEKSGFDCLFSTNCEGNCCAFGLSTCEYALAETETEPSSNKEGTTWASDQSGGVCGPGCIAVSVLVPLVLIVLVVFWVRRVQAGIDSDTRDTAEPAENNGAIYML